MGDTFLYLTYAFNVGRKKDKSRRSYVSIGDVCFEIEFTVLCFLVNFLYLLEELIS